MKEAADIRIQYIGTFINVTRCSFLPCSLFNGCSSTSWKVLSTLWSPSFDRQCALSFEWWVLISPLLAASRTAPAQAMPTLRPVPVVNVWLYGWESVWSLTLTEKLPQSSKALLLCCNPRPSQSGPLKAGTDPVNLHSNDLQWI
jgi:hypothetical protein